MTKIVTLTLMRANKSRGGDRTIICFALGLTQHPVVDRGATRAAQ